MKCAIIQSSPAGFRKRCEPPLLSFAPASGPNDHVFVYFTDHGAPGILAFPNDDVSSFLLPAAGSDKTL